MAQVISHASRSWRTESAVTCIVNAGQKFFSERRLACRVDLEVELLVSSQQVL